jgi:hypothetical protein
MWWHAPLKVLTLLAAFWFVFPFATTYSEIWDARTHPKAGVDVELPSRMTLRGELSRTWAGDYELRTPDGAVHLFHDFSSMSVPLPMPDDGDGFLWKHWRAKLLPMLLSGAILVAVLYVVVDKSHWTRRT